MKKDLQKEILDKIKKGEVKMKPKEKFELERKALIGIWILTLVTSAIFILMVVLFFEVYNPAEMMELGDVGKQLLIEDFPYLWFMGGLGMIIGGILIDQRMGDNYKTPTIKLSLIVTGVVLILTILFRFLIG